MSNLICGIGNSIGGISDSTSGTNDSTGEMSDRTGGIGSINCIVSELKGGTDNIISGRTG